MPLPVIPPGLIVQVPAGNEFRITLPVATVQLGWVIVPIAGAEGIDGCVFITVATDADDVHPIEFVTV